MLKRVIIISLPIIAAIGIIVFILLKHSKNNEVELIHAVPTDAAVIFEINNFKSGFEKLRSSVFYNDLIKTPPLYKAGKDFQFIDSLIRSNGKISEILDKKPVIISLHNEGRYNMAVIVYLDCQNVINHSLFRHLINEWISAKQYLSKRSYENIEVYEYKNIQNQQTLFFSFINDIFLLSGSSILLEKAIREFYSEKPQYNEKGYVKARQSASKYVDANIYLNYKNLPSALLSVLSNKFSNLKVNPPLADWAELDLSIKNDAVLFTGITLSDNTATNYYSLFSEQVPSQTTTEQIIPSYTSAFYILNISHYPRFIEKCKEFMEKSGKSRSYTIECNEIERNYGLQVENFTNELFDNEAAMLFSENEAMNITLIKTKSQSITLDKLKQIIASESKSKNIPEQKFLQRINLDDETNVTIYNLSVKNLPALMFGNIFWKSAFTYFSFYNNYLVLANTTEAIKQFHLHNLHRKTIINEPAYKSFSQYLSSKINFYFYMNTPKAKNFLQDNLNPSFFADIQKNFNIYKKFEALAFQFSAENNLFYNNFCFRYLPVIAERPKTVWETKLDTALASKPALLVYHKTGEREIFVQDVENNIYLITNSGRILWKLQVPEPIKSAIYQVDAFKNRKLQILFSTKNFIYLIDHDGNFVERFPVKLRSPATNGISLFDYDNNKEYRMFVATESKKIYVYDIKGNLVKGWNYNASDQLVNKEIQYFRVDNKDYIVFADDIKAYFLDRQGNERIKPKKYFNPSPNNRFSLDKTGITSRFVTTDTSGSIIFIYPDGDVEKTNVKNCSPNHYFDFQDIDKDGRKDFIFLDNNLLEIYSQNLKKILTFEFPGKLKYGFYLYDFGQSGLKTGLISEEMKEILLIDYRGELHKGFPLKGTTPFSIGFLKKPGGNFNLIVGNEDNFLYNYLVE